MEAGRLTKNDQAVRRDIIHGKVRGYGSLYKEGKKLRRVPEYDERVGYMMDDSGIAYLCSGKSKAGKIVCRTLTR